MPLPFSGPRKLDLPPQPTVDVGRYPKSMHAAVAHAHGTEDAVYAASPAPRMHAALGRFARRSVSGDIWLPEGWQFDLHVEHRPLESAGAFTGGGNKLCWHITISSWNTVDLIWTVLRDKRAAPQLIIGGRQGWDRPVVIQCQPLNQAGRALAHPSGPETNRADVIQVEICANVADVAKFDELGRYKAFANLVRLVNNVTSPNIPWELARSFTNTTRFSGQGWVDAAGHLGHMHCPGNDHTDPTTAFQGGTLIGRLQNMPAGGYPL
jgi:hypothetical protein